jgi:hypothetical protein
MNCTFENGIKIRNVSSFYKKFFNFRGTLPSDPTNGGTPSGDLFTSTYPMVFRTGYRSHLDKPFNLNVAPATFIFIEMKITMGKGIEPRPMVACTKFIDIGYHDHLVILLTFLSYCKYVPSRALSFCYK